MSSRDTKTGTVVPLSRFRAALARPRGAKRLDALLSAEDAQKAVQELTVPDLYFLVEEVGLDDCTELLALASNEQIQGCLDLDVWDRDELQIEAILPWLRALEEAGYEHFTSVWASLDPELTALTLARLCRIYDLGLGDEPPEDDELPAFTTPDTFFYVVLTSDSEENSRHVYRLIEDLYRGDLALARFTLMAARSELPSYLEEECYRFRSGRMADLGYVDFDEALEVFRPIDPASVAVGEDSAQASALRSSIDPTETLPVPILEHVIGRSFLARALERISDAREVERLQAALLYLVNRVLAAARVRPGDRDAVDVAAYHATATVALGLEFISDGDLDQAEAALRSVSLTRLHRLGYTMCLRLSRHARVLAPRAVGCDPITQQVLEGLLGRRPFYATALDQPGEHDLRPFESRRDLARVADNLKRLALRIAVATALGADLVALSQVPEPRPGLDDFARTAVVRATLGHEFEPAPLSADELGGFARRLLAGIDDAERQRIASLLSKALDRAEVVEARDTLPELLAAWWQDLEETFGELGDKGTVDARFVTGVVCTGVKD